MSDLKKFPPLHSDDVAYVDFVTAYNRASKFLIDYAAVADFETLRTDLYTMKAVFDQKVRDVKILQRQKSLIGITVQIDCNDLL